MARYRVGLQVRGRPGEPTTGGAEPARSTQAARVRHGSRRHALRCVSAQRCGYQGVGVRVSFTRRWTSITMAVAVFCALSASMALAVAVAASLAAAVAVTAAAVCLAACACTVSATLVCIPRSVSVADTETAGSGASEEVGTCRVTRAIAPNTTSTTRPAIHSKGPHCTFIARARIRSHAPAVDDRLPASTRANNTDGSDIAAARVTSNPGAHTVEPVNFSVALRTRCNSRSSSISSGES